MAKNDSYLNLHTTRVRQLILKYKEIKQENDELYSLIDERDKQIAALTEEVKKLKSDYSTLKLARMIEVADGDVEDTRKRVSQLIREVNQCITLLSEK